MKLETERAIISFGTTEETTCDVCGFMFCARGDRKCHFSNTSNNDNDHLGTVHEAKVGSFTLIKPEADSEQTTLSSTNH